MKVFTFAVLLALPLLALAPAAAPVGDAAAVESEKGGCSHLRATALAAPDPLELLLPVCTGIRPGAGISSPGGSCTMAWIVQSGSTYYGTTAGHCGSVGQRIKLTSINQEVGTMIYAVDQPIGEDFGVFRIDASRNGIVNPDMCAWGGATGVWTGSGGTGSMVRHFGFGLVTGTTQFTRARSGVFDYANPTTFAFQGAVAPGDSGSPARLANGQALGVITDLWAPRLPGDGPLVPADRVLLTQLAIGTRLDHGLAQASAATGITFTLVTGTPDNEFP